MACETRRPRHQSQLNRAFGGVHGGVNCTASAAAMAAEAVMCGPDRAILGKDVRRESNEPVPDPDSPGLSLGQVTDALAKITGNAVQLTIKQPIRMERLERRLRRGQVAVLQVKRSVLISQGHGLGRAFAGPHAVTIGFDRDELWVDDPLGRRKYMDITFADLGEAAAALELSGGRTVGQGFAYAAFGIRPRARKATSTIRIPAGTRVKRFKMKGGLFFEVQPITIPVDVDAACSEARRTHAHPSGPAFGRRPRNLVVVLTGPEFLRGYGVLDDAPGVTIEEADDPGQPPLDSDAAALDVLDVTSPDVVDDPSLLEVSEADRAALESADVEPADVKNDDVGEPLLPDDFVEEEEEELLKRDGS